MHNAHLHIFVTDLRGHVRCLLGVEGAIFNVMTIAEKLETPEGLRKQITNSWKDDNEQLEIVLQPWLKKNGDTKDPDSLRKDLADLKEEDYKVTQRGQMHISHLRELAVKISELKIKNAELTTYFSGKIQDLCKKVLRDCCIELESSVEDVERVASYESYGNYLENYPQISQSTALKYEQMCSSSEESMAKHFLSIVPHLIQDVKAICRDEMIPDVQNGLRGLQKEILNKHASDVREAKTEQQHPEAYIVSDELDVDEVFVRDCFDVSSTLIHFAKSDPSKLVRFELTDSTNHPVTCKRESVVHDTDNDTYSQVFFLRKESEEELLLRAAARVP
ncbi:hypothetical protein OS493_034493 [Desmophyllum pertusum]|uniref:Uncharacterized protein n=1 Tax=Desmophyllum pertusum TaxID=174260 RepID=A0A9X0CNP3_9CNID|nr:hypothetical protein OS493_034493 [Desmophyllum pertusum]